VRVVVAMAETDGEAPPHPRGLPPAIRQRIERIRRPEERSGRIVHMGLLDEATRHLGLGEQLAMLRHDPQGRPFLEGMEGVGVSFSRSRGIAVCAVGFPGMVGIDVEALGGSVEEIPLDRLGAGVRQRVLAADDPVAEFLVWWTTMEAVMKLEGTGLAGPWERLRVCHGGAELDGRRRRVRRVGVGEGFVCALATEGECDVEVVVPGERRAAHVDIHGHLRV
jgi:phosphopantetheinyl transferase